MRPAHRIRFAAVGATALLLAACSAGTSDSRAGTLSSPASSRMAGPSSASASTTPAYGTRTTGPHPKAARSVTIAVSGDEIPHPAVLAAARRGIGWDFGPMFAQIAPVLRSADVAICQLETPLGASGVNLSHGFTMGAPAAFAVGLRRAGFDGCSTANNHSFDQGVAGLRETRRIMGATGLQAAGPAADASHPAQPAIYHAKGFTIAQLAYSYTLDNTVGDSSHVPAAAPWTAANLYDVVGVAGIEKDAQAARAQGADLVLVSMHWGEEQDPHPTTEQRRIARELLTSGTVDYIIGNHPHVVQPCERIDGRMVNYSFGNDLSDQFAGIVAYGGAVSTEAAQDGLIALVTFTRDTDGKITSTERLQPTRVDRANSHVIRLVSKASDPASWQRTTSVATAGGNSCGATPLH
ncbi:CapA family protein [Flexivirga caeni]|uniref:CapA family protein n=1 Tax=Flexivirga caeni TaxID=2294115 RepID=A0A3M9MIV9_9MICO|nr:CapA family protein [Flexivirga caeni]RNI25097.1 CapA family protein [Flexivirga caeni]